MNWPSETGAATGTSTAIAVLRPLTPCEGPPSPLAPFAFAASICNRLLQEVVEPLRASSSPPKSWVRRLAMPMPGSPLSAGLEEVWGRGLLKSQAGWAAGTGLDTAASQERASRL